MSLKPTRIPKLLVLAKNRTCVACHIHDDTTVAAHYQGFRSHTYGKGRGIKPHDAMSAQLCFRCHGEADRSGLAKGRIEHSAAFLRYIIVTHLRLYLDGQLYADTEAGQLLAELCQNARALMQEREDSLHHIAMEIAEHYDSGALQPITRRGACVGDFVGVVYAGG